MKDSFKYFNCLIFLFIVDSSENINKKNFTLYEEILDDNYLEEITRNKSINNSDDVNLNATTVTTNISPITVKYDNKLNNHISNTICKNNNDYSSVTFSPQYRSNISPRHTVISRRNNSERSQNSTMFNYKYCSFNDSAVSLKITSTSTASNKCLK